MCLQDHQRPTYVGYTPSRHQKASWRLFMQKNRINSKSTSVRYLVLQDLLTVTKSYNRFFLSILTQIQQSIILYADQFYSAFCIADDDERSVYQWDVFRTILSGWTETETVQQDDDDECREVPTNTHVLRPHAMGDIFSLSESRSAFTTLAPDNTSSSQLMPSSSSSPRLVPHPDADHGVIPSDDGEDNDTEDGVDN